MTTRSDTIIAHLTDIHYPSRVGLGLSEFSFKRFLGFLNWHLSRKKLHLKKTLDEISKDVLCQKLDHLIVSGDLVNWSLKAEYKEGLKWLEQFGSFEDVSFVPGNHDYYGANPVLFADANEGGLSAYMTSNSHGFELGGDAGPHLPFVRVINDVALIFLNSGVPTPLFKAYGAVNRKSLEVLVDILTQAKMQDLYRCVILHHPPLTGITSPSRGLTNDHELQTLLENYGAELVLYGHNHKQRHDKLSTKTGTCHVIGTPSASVGRHGRYELARYNLFHIQRKSNSWITQMDGRGLLEDYGPVVDLEDRLLV